MTTRADFVGRVTAALGRRGPSVAPLHGPPPSDESVLRLVGPNEDLASRFVSRASSAGILVHRCFMADVASAFSQVLRTVGGSRVVVDGLAPDLLGAVRPALAGCDVLDPVMLRSLDSQFDAHASITGVVAAIAETGTLVVASDAGRSRGAFIVPPVHIAIVSETDLIPDMLDLWPRVGRPPTALTLISGPSKTADIEGILVTGVHGPGAVHAILVAPAR
jgi:L-lactate dehydrogenase complex protein LldG